VLDEIAARGPQVIALSGHDSTPWTYGAFSRRFGDRYAPCEPGKNCASPPLPPEPRGQVPGSWPRVRWTVVVLPSAGALSVLAVSLALVAVGGIAFARRDLA
jgi:hypothetical protein